MIGRYRSMSILVLLAVSVCIFELPIRDMLLCRPGVSEVVFICRGLSCYVGDGSLPYSLTLCAKKTSIRTMPPCRPGVSDAVFSYKLLARLVDDELP